MNGIVFFLAKYLEFRPNVQLHISSLYVVILTCPVLAES